MVGIVSTYIEHFTYLGLLLVLIACGLGLPVPEDVALLAGGYLAHRGITEYPVTLAVSLVGVVTGDCSLFFLGRRFGTGWLKYVGVLHPGSRRGIARMRRFMNRHGHRAVFYARFLAGLRALVYICAGSFGVPVTRFLMYDFMGAVISVPIVVSLGYLFGNEIGQILRYLGGMEKALLLVAALSLLIWLMRIVVLAKPDNTSGKKPQPEVD